MSRAFLFFIFCLIHLYTFGQTNVPATELPVKVTSRLTPDSAFVGDNIFYVLSIERDKSYTLLYPTDQDSSFGKLELRKTDKKTLKDENNVLNEETIFTLAGYDTGLIVVPDVRIRYLEGNKGGHDEKSFLAKGGSVFIKSVLDTSKRVVTIKSIKSASFPYWIIAVSVAGFLALVGLGYFFYKKLSQKPKKKIEPSVPQKSPYEIAWEKLHYIQDFKFRTEEDFKLFYTNLSLILREFLERQLLILALEQTANEIYDALFYKVKQDELELIKKILDQSDLVKFAKFTPTEFDAKTCLHLCRQYISLYKTTVISEINSIEKSSN